MTIQEWLEQATEQLKQLGINSAELDAKLLLCDVIGEDKTYLIAHSKKSLSQSTIDRANQLLNQRKTYKPIAYITNRIEFFGLELLVNESVLIPRPETEALVSAALELPANNVLDVGTGSGAIAIALKSNRPNLKITATDISEQSLVVARKNADALNTPLKIVSADLFVDGQFDLITANLPYVPEGKAIGHDVAHEPSLALYSGADGLTLINDFIANLGSHLNPGGSALIEHLPSQFEEIKRIANSYDFKIKQVSDYVSRLF